MPLIWIVDGSICNISLVLFLLSKVRNLSSSKIFDSFEQKSLQIHSERAKTVLHIYLEIVIFETIYNH